MFDLRKGEKGESGKIEGYLRKRKSGGERRVVGLGLGLGFRNEKEVENGIIRKAMGRGGGDE